MTPRPACLVTGDQAQHLVACCEAPIRGPVLAALGTGMRLGELLGLRADCVRLGGAVLVERTLHRNGDIGPVKSQRSRRSIGLSPRTVEVFADLIDGKRADDLVFASPQGQPWDAGNLRSRYWLRAVASAQQCDQHPPWYPGSESVCRCQGRLTTSPQFRDLRHSHVATLIDAGWDFYMIQLRLGHASIKTTFDIYGHLLPHNERDGLQALDERLPVLASGSPVHRAGAPAG